MTHETKVGFFVLLGTSVLIFGIVMLSDIPLKRGYYLNVLFGNVEGLPSQAQVFISGISVGKVKSITLREDYRAWVRVRLESHVKIHNDARAHIISSGFVGNKYVELTSGSTALPLLPPEAEIIGEDPVSLEKKAEKAIKALDRLVDTVEGVTGRGGLKDAVENIVVASRNIREITYDVKAVTNQNKGRITSILEKADSLLLSLDAIAKKVDSGEGTLGKMLTDKEMAQDFKETVTNVKDASKGAKNIFNALGLWSPQVNYRLRYDVKDDRFRSDIGVRLSLKHNRFLAFGLSNLGDTPLLDSQEGNTATALVGQGFGPFEVFGGAIRSTGGFGLQAKPYHNKVILEALAFNLDRRLPHRSPEVNAGAKFAATRWLYLGAAVEDVFFRSSFNASVDIVIEP